ncbi:hypothetical protein [Cellulomonas denverensis]|uniref:Uncharacterized protein n=1 Tax=Cellulomonas denverensis TaxID=264297 RepID=A0A7X6KUA0_9CELL|nr:hypothetical protein [Cellulomonas denverensis]NKY22263.1 hypothetical protein [Cellulomonas denverensis]GIG26930.1 hypothetical protein Cde04nite_31740 [Cellulomonas denverensis]
MKKRLAAVVGVIGVAVAVVVLPTGAATSAVPCSYSSMIINSNPRAEGPTRASGHAHVTGNHYVRSMTNKVWYYTADNNGGSDGDTWDTAYGVAACN